MRFYHDRLQAAGATLELSEVYWWAHAIDTGRWSPKLTPQVASPRLIYKRELTAKPLKINSRIVGSRK